MFIKIGQRMISCSQDLKQGPGPPRIPTYGQPLTDKDYFNYAKQFAT
jgi:hypothetical protein